MNKPVTPNNAGAPHASGLVARRELWTRHWASGAAHSCASSYGDRYGGEIAEFWRRRFANLTTGQRVLDLATGNGALPRLLVETMPELDVTIDAIDIAAIAPAWTASLTSTLRRRVRFHADQRIEAMPFAGGGFDMVVSQYGIEYADLDRAIAELLRVTAPGAQIALLMHAANSRPVTLAKVELAHLSWLLSADGLLAAADLILEPIGRSTTAHGRAQLAADPQAACARDRFNAAQDALKARAESADGADVLFEVQDAVTDVLSLALQGHRAGAHQRLRAARLAAEDSRSRLEQLRRHALRGEQLAAMGDALRPAARSDGFVELGEVWERGHLMGCTLSARLSRHR